jgi:Thiol-disulfide isomerase and thioredoxins
MSIVTNIISAGEILDLGLNCQNYFHMDRNIYILLLAVLFCHYTVIGQESKLESELAKIIERTRSKSISIGKLYNLYYDTVKKVNDTSIKNKLQQKLDSLDIIDKENNKKELSLIFKFIRQHTTSFFSLYILDIDLHNMGDLQLYDSFYKAFSGLSKNLQISKKGKEFKEALINLKNSTIGKIAPDFTMNDYNNQKLSLSSFRKANYVLLDFWASWCRPCRDDFPYLKDLYTKYHSKGFEILNISRDDNIKAWKAAIQTDGIDIWKHASSKQNGDGILKSYFVNAIPVKILIDKEGIIIGRWLGSGQANQAALTKALKQIY